MGLAVEPPVLVPLACRDDDDKLHRVLWRRSDNVTPISILTAQLTMTFDLPNDDTWERDPDTDEPIQPARQIHVITSNTPGDPDGWIDDTNFETGELLVYVSHNLWAGFLPPHTGTYSLVALSADSVQRCLTRGPFTMETAT